VLCEFVDLSMADHVFQDIHHAVYKS